MKRKQHSLDLPAAYSPRGFVREKLQDLPARQRARDQKRRGIKPKAAAAPGRSDDELDRDSQIWLDGIESA